MTYNDASINPRAFDSKVARALTRDVGALFSNSCSKSGRGGGAVSYISWKCANHWTLGLEHLFFFFFFFCGKRLTGFSSLILRKVSLLLL